MERYRFKVEGMCCSRCVDAIRDALSRLDGINDIEASSGTETVEVRAYATAKERVQRAIPVIGVESVR